MFKRLFRGGDLPLKGDTHRVSTYYDPVPVTLLTGFLGSGKTTLLNDILSDPRMAGTAVIINEFGSVPIDHGLVQRGSEGYFQTTTGCICCTATSDVRASLFELHSAIVAGEISDINRVVIETTGLADPAPIINSLIPGGAPAFGLRDHIVARHFFLAGVVATFDVLNGRATLDGFIEGWKQLAFSDHVILTKADLVATQHDWKSELTSLNPAAHLYERLDIHTKLDTVFSDSAYSMSGKAEDVFGWLALEKLSKHSLHNHDPNRHGEIQAVCLTHDTLLDPRMLQTFLHVVTTNMQSGLLRLKGIFALQDDADRPLIAHAVQHRLYPPQRLQRWPDVDRSSRLVLIGRDMPLKQITELFDALIPRPSRRKGELHE
ncbi:GTP-binding protein [Ochrobactrum sp. S46]|nr:GTP-binding protein [Ochrobactrum sp. S45]MBK0046413.1 GTP-binding protein [Ochrobactrum sp. S46]